MASKIVHVGYPKAGSSYLQKNIFPQISNHEYINYTTAKYFSHYLLNSGLFFQTSKAFELLPAGKENIILSNELLIGNPISGIGVNAERTPLKLKECGFNKVIISLRRDHGKWLKSLYNEFVKLGGKLHYDDFLKNPERHDSEYTLYHPDSIKYCEQYVSYYQDVFGKENVLVLYIEDMKSDQQMFINSILQFLQSNDVIQIHKPENESMPGWMQSGLRFLNNFLSSRMSPSSALRWFSSGRMLHLLQMVSGKSIRK